MVGTFAEASSATGINGNQVDNSAVDSGAVYVFERSGSAWSQQAYLKASNTGGGDSFGSAVGIFGSTVVVGANFETSSATGADGNLADNSLVLAGAVYVFDVLGSSTVTTPSLCASPATFTVGGNLAVGATIELTVVNPTGLPFCGYGFAPAIGLPAPCGCAVLADPTGAALGDFTFGATRTLTIPPNPIFVGVEVQGVDAFPTAGGCSLAGLSLAVRPTVPPRMPRRGADRQYHHQQQHREHRAQQPLIDARADDATGEAADRAEADEQQQLMSVQHQAEFLQRVQMRGEAAERLQGDDDEAGADCGRIGSLPSSEGRHGRRRSKHEDAGRQHHADERRHLRRTY